MSEQTFTVAAAADIGRDLVSADAERRCGALDLPFNGAGTVELWRQLIAAMTASNRKVGVRRAKGRLEKSYCYKMAETPVGVLKLLASDDGLAAILWENDNPRRVRLNVVVQDSLHPVLLETERQLKEYFGAQRRSFDLRLDFAGSAFQCKVWRALLEIPFGETRSYAEIARQIGSPKAVRAVGAANGRNPLSIVVPCHRVIGTNGKLTGFAGGLQTKAFLLNLERA